MSRRERPPAMQRIGAMVALAMVLILILSVLAEACNPAGPVGV